MELEAP